MSCLIYKRTTANIFREKGNRMRSREKARGKTSPISAATKKLSRSGAPAMIESEL